MHPIVRGPVAACRREPRRIASRAVACAAWLLFEQNGCSTVLYVAICTISKVRAWARGRTPRMQSEVCDCAACAPRSATTSRNENRPSAPTIAGFESPDCMRGARPAFLELIKRCRKVQFREIAQRDQKCCGKGTCRDGEFRSKPRVDSASVARRRSVFPEASRTTARPCATDDRESSISFCCRAGEHLLPDRQQRPVTASFQSLCVPARQTVPCPARPWSGERPAEQLPHRHHGLRRREHPPLAERSSRRADGRRRVAIDQAGWT